MSSTRSSRMDYRLICRLRLPALLIVLLVPGLVHAGAGDGNPAGIAAVADRQESCCRLARNADFDAPPAPPIPDSNQHRLQIVLAGNSETLRDAIVNDAEESFDQGAADLDRAPLLLLGKEVAPASSVRLAWDSGLSFTGIASETPVLVANGADSGPVMCLTAAVHGDELNGIEVVRRVLHNLDVSELKGTVIGVPIVNLSGFRSSSRYLPDRRDLNRFFPGNPHGSLASRIAHSLFSEVISRCNVLIDLHTGSFHRSNLPQLRADLNHPEVRQLAENFGELIVIHNRGGRGTLRLAAVNAGIPAVTLEAGEPLRFEMEAVEQGVRHVFALMDQMGMLRRIRVWGNPSPVFYQSRWIRASAGGILFGAVELGQQVSKGERLGHIVDPITNVSTEIISRWDGRVFGMAVDQVVMPGYAAFHIGIAPRGKDDYPFPDADDGEASGMEPPGNMEDLDDAE